MIIIMIDAKAEGRCTCVALFGFLARRLPPIILVQYRAAAVCDECE